MKKIILILILLISTTKVYATDEIKLIEGSNECKIRAIQNEKGYYINADDYFSCYKENTYSIKNKKVTFTRVADKFIDIAKNTFEKPKITSIVDLKKKNYITYLKTADKTYTSGVKNLYESSYIIKKDEIYFSLRLFSDVLKGSFTLTSSKLNLDFKNEISQSTETSIKSKEVVKTSNIDNFSKEYADKYLGEYDYEVCKDVLNSTYCLPEQKGVKVCGKECVLKNDRTTSYPISDPRRYTQYEWVTEEEGVICKTRDTYKSCNEYSFGNTACGYTCMATGSYKESYGQIYDLTTYSGIKKFELEVGRKELGWNDEIAKFSYDVHVKNMKNYQQEAATIVRQSCSDQTCGNCESSSRVVSVGTSLQGLKTDSTLFQKNSTNGYSTCETFYEWIANDEVEEAIRTKGYRK